MKKTAIAIIAIPLGLASYVAFHPGVADAGPLDLGPVTSLNRAGNFTVDPVHTSIGFEIRHLGIATVHGRFNKKSGKLKVDLKDLTKSSIDFSIETASIDTNVEPRDKHLRSADFFEVEKYPNITFKSTKIRKSGNGYVAEGDLTIKAITRKVSIPFKHYGPITDPWGNQRIGVIANPITIDRQDYGVAYDQKLPDGTPAVANKLQVRIAMEATLDK